MVSGVAFSFSSTKSIDIGGDVESLGFRKHIETSIYVYKRFVD